MTFFFKERQKNLGIYFLSKSRNAAAGRALDTDIIEKKDFDDFNRPIFGSGTP